MQRFGRHEVHLASHLEIKVWHQSHTKKNRRKKYLVGSTDITLGDIFKRQDSPKSSKSRYGHRGHTLSFSLHLIRRFFQSQMPSYKQARPQPWYHEAAQLCNNHSPLGIVYFPIRLTHCNARWLL
jgi:hypothetical protein